MCTEATADFKTMPATDNDSLNFRARFVSSTLPVLRHHRSLEIPGDMEQLAVVRNFVRHVCENEIVPPMAADDTAMMELAVNECVSNVIRHAYKGGTNESVQIVTDTYDDQIHLRVYDQGDSFDPNEVPEPQFDGSADGGFGLFIISACMDQTWYNRDNQGRNCFTMVKRLATDRCCA